MKDTLNDVLTKAADFLVKKQKKEGCWDCDKSTRNQPSVYMTDLVLTSEAIWILNLIKNKDHIHNIKHGIFFCSEYELQGNDSVVPWAWKLIALKHSNTKYSEGLKKQIIDNILKQQKNGYWQSFPTTSNLDNFYTVMALFDTKNEGVIEKTKRWFENNMAKDGIGWGLDQNAEKSEVSFTANVAIALILAGASPESKRLNGAKKFIESMQRKSGAWLSTKYTLEEETVYATSLMTLALMLLSDNPFSESVEKGIKYVLNSQLKDGSWSHVAGDKKGMIYTTLFSALLLSFYKYLKDNLAQSDELIKTPVSTCLLFKQFMRDSNKNMMSMTFSKMFDSKMLGSTINAIDRRKDILSVLLTCGSKDIAAVIDELKKQEKYNYLNKKHHITQIKSDMEYLKDIKIIDKIHDLYFICQDFFNIA